jgi:hypothetical protein
VYVYMFDQDYTEGGHQLGPVDLAMVICQLSDPYRVGRMVGGPSPH